MSYLNDKIDFKNAIMNIGRHMFPKLFVRPMFTIVSDLQSSGEMSKDISIVEVGTDLGLNARNIKQFVSFDTMYLIDPYFDDYGRYSSGDKRFDIAKKRVGYSDDIVFIRDTSEVASTLFKYDSVDCVYIDGVHSYEHVMQDIKLWYPKVKKGGIIGGHDFFGSGLGVILAVTDYVDKNNLREKLDGFGTDWWIRK